MGTSEGGLNKFDRKRRKFRHYQQEAQNPRSLSRKSVSSIYEDRDGVLWIGTYGGGLNQLVQAEADGAPTFKHYRHDIGNPNSLSNDVVLSIYQDQSGTIWIGTISGGLNQFNPKEGVFYHYQHDPEIPGGLNNNRVTSIYESVSESG